MTNDEIKDLIREVAASAKQVNLMTGDHAQAIYNEAREERKETREVTPEDVVTVLKSGRVTLPTDGSIAVVYAVCRDVYNWDMGLATFERTMSLQGIRCKEGTLSNTLRKHSYMRDHIDKWAVLGAKEEILKVRDSFIEAMNLLPSSQS